VFQINILADALGLQYEPLLDLKISDRPCKSYDFKKCPVHRCANLFTCGPGPQINLIPDAGLNFLIDMRYAHARFLEMCGLLPGDYNLTSDCHGDSMSADFSPPICSPTGEAGKNAETGFMRCFPNCHYRKQWLVKG
jgi:hypothetical protein